jgi:pyrroloquinoline quinone biosynthesis protein B
MKVRILGAAAGGGFPQWNCNCSNCRRLRRGFFRGNPRTQDSIGVSSDDSRWVLLNASPDLREQILRSPELSRSDAARGTSIASILLSDAELDHVSGLLSLRERQPIRVYSTPTVFGWVFEANSMFKFLLGPSRLVWNEVTFSEPRLIQSACGGDTQLKYEAVAVSEKSPSYTVAPGKYAGSVVAYRIIDARSSKSLLYVPAVREMDDELVAIASECDCLIMDGTFWSEDEMRTTGTGTASAYTMGHLSIGGPRGSMRRLHGLTKPRKIYTHINNTNPILDESSDERVFLRDAGWEVAEDGMFFQV